VHRKTGISRNTSQWLKRHPASLIKLADLDVLLEFLFNGFVKADNSDKDYRELARDLIDDMIEWVPSDPIVSRGIERRCELIDEFQPLSDDDKDAFQISYFWSEYERIHGSRKKRT
jgi:hypothetical protein